MRKLAPVVFETPYRSRFAGGAGEADRAVGRARDGPATLMNESVVAATEQDQVVEIGFAS